jgi:hypothetical protein
MNRVVSIFDLCSAVSITSSPSTSERASGLPILCFSTTIFYIFSRMMIQLQPRYDLDSIQRVYQADGLDSQGELYLIPLLPAYLQISQEAISAIPHLVD